MRLHAFRGSMTQKQTSRDGVCMKYWVFDIRRLCLLHVLFNMEYFLNNQLKGRKKTQADIAQLL